MVGRPGTPKQLRIARPHLTVQRRHHVASQRLAKLPFKILLQARFGRLIFNRRTAQQSPETSCESGQGQPMNIALNRGWNEPVVNPYPANRHRTVPFGNDLVKQIDELYVFRVREQNVSAVVESESFRSCNGSGAPTRNLGLVDE